MNYSPLKSRIIPMLATVTLAAGAFACGGAAENADLDTSTALLVAEEEADVGADAVAGSDEATIAETAAEEAAITPEPGDANSFEPCNFAARRQQVLEAFDADADGQLNRQERAAVADAVADRASHRPVASRILKRRRKAVGRRVRWAFDEDGDRALSQTEKDELIAAMQSRCQLRYDRILDQFDADGSGDLSDEELTAVRAARRARTWRSRAHSA